MVGPFRGGRTVSAVGIPGKPNQYLMGAVGGGVWKTSNSGSTWEPIFDSEPIASIGAIAVAPSNPQIIFVGSGEADMRSDISFGDGVYKSFDGGATWKNVGLRDSQQIGRILVDPRDSNIVLVAALGHAYGPNSERGVYRSTDGGANWQRVLSKDDDTGAIDLAFDPDNSSTVYASLWQTRRPPWSVYGPTNGPGSGLYKSNDGGLNWQPINGGGFPIEGLGRIGIAVAAGTHGNRVFALADAKEGGVYRSDDAGKSWTHVSSDHRVWQRGWYFGGITVDPRDSNQVYVANTALYRSRDGGEHFEAFKGAPGGDDYHSLWIAPEDSDRMILASDQGSAVSVDGGKTWGSWYNQPTAQFYHVITDNRFPYRIYGSQQDSGTAAIASRGDYGQITFRDWSPIGGQESGYIAPSPSDPNIVFGGGPYGVATRFNFETSQSLDISPWPLFAMGANYRFTWTSPIVLCPQDPHVLYIGAQFVLRTNDGGQSWKAISPDLTVRNTPGGAASAKPDERGVVYTIAPSPVTAGKIWAGTDNGLLQLTTDAGATWTNVTPAAIGEWSKVSLIEASRFSADVAYVALDRHELDDNRPYIYRTRDSGKTWENVVAGLPANAYVRAVREDRVAKGLLFAGTELGVYVSIDDGDHWRPLQNNLPVTSIRDLTIHGDDLIVATHGRAFWVLDDIEPLREVAVGKPTGDAYLFKAVDAIRIRRSENTDTPLPPETPVGKNPPSGAIFDYSLGREPASPLTLEIHDSDGKLIRRFSSSDKAPTVAEPPEFASYWLPQFSPLRKSMGVHRFVWDLRYPSPSVIENQFAMTAVIGGGTVTTPEGPLVVPGRYEAWLSADGQIYKQSFVVKMDPRVRIAQTALEQQLALQLTVDEALKTATLMHREIETVQAKLQTLSADTSRPEALRTEASAMAANTAQMLGGAAQFPAPASGLGAVEATLSAVAAGVDSADGTPTAQHRAAFELATQKLGELARKWDEFKTTRLAPLNRQLGQAGIPQIPTE